MVGGYHSSINMETKMSSENVSRLGRGKDKDQNNQNIQVFVRVRPMNSMELNKNAMEVVDTPGSTSVVVRERSVGTLPRTFTFDKVFGTRSRQVDVYKTVVAPLVNEVLLGYNCTVFAYGQTGTGKTFTMEGERSAKNTSTVDLDPLAGILPRALSQLFDEVRMMNCEFTVRVSFLELYNEELFDLLAPIEDSRPRTLRLFEDIQKKGSVIIQGLEEVIVQSKHEVYAVLDRGSQQRKTAATLMNATSSRSHTVFTITVHMKESSVEGEEMLKVGKLYLVDLAGSENIGKSGAVDKRAREAGNINMSLLTLGRVITALVEHTPHVPYRESKLTRLLQDSLGGKTKTSIIATVSPAATNIEETLSTLDYAFRARHIQNRPEVNQRLTKKEALNIYTEEIERLRRDLNATREKNGVFMDNENYSRTMAQIEAQHRELNEKSNKILNLEETVTAREDEIRGINETVQDLRLDLQTNKTLLQETRACKRSLESKLSKAERRIEELTHLLEYHEKTERKMNTEASSLLNTASDTVSMIEALHSRLERKQVVEERNWKNAERFRGEFRQSMNKLIASLTKMREDCMIHTSDLRDVLNENKIGRQGTIEGFVKKVTTSLLEVRGVDDKLYEIFQQEQASISKNLTSTTDVLESKCEKSKEVLTTFSNLSNQKTKQCKEVISGVQQEVKELQVVLDEGFSEMAGKFTYVMNAAEERFGEILRVTGHIRDTWSSYLEQAIGKWEKVAAAQDKYQDSQLAKIQGLEQSLQLLKREMIESSTGTINSIKEIEHNTEKIAGCLDHMVQDALEKCNVGKEAANTGAKAAPKLRDRVVTGSTKSLEGWVEKLNSCTSNVQDAEKMLEKTQEEAFDNMTNAATACRKVSTEVQKDLRGMGGKFDQVMKAHVNGLGEISEVCESSFKYVSTMENNLSEQIRASLDKNCDATTGSASDISSGLHKAAGTVEEFWDETYLTDSPSGATPMRKKYELPKKLSYPSPQERVLARFRTFTNDLQVVMDDREEDELDSLENEAVGQFNRYQMEESKSSANDENEDPDSTPPASARRLETINECSESSKLSLDLSRTVSCAESSRPASVSSEKSIKSGSESSAKESKELEHERGSNKGAQSKKKQRRKSGPKKKILQTPN